MAIGKIVGLDLGSKTCGVAISDGLGMFAHPVETLYYTESMDELRTPLESIIKENRVKEIALGFPKMMNNDIGERAQISQQFKEMLEAWFDCSVILIDERLTSVVANRQLIAQDVSRRKRKKVVDQLAAVHILQTYLDKRKFMEEK